MTGIILAVYLSVGAGLLTAASFEVFLTHGQKPRMLSSILFIWIWPAMLLIGLLAVRGGPNNEEVPTPQPGVRSQRRH